MVRGLSELGQTVIFITHKLVEVTKVADRVSVMRGGKMIGTKKVAETDIPEMARMMVGRDVLFRVKKEAATPGEVVFEAKDLTVLTESGVPAVQGLSLKVHSGEILGVAGVSGNGQSELVDAIAGIRPAEMGSLHLENETLNKLDVAARRERGVAHIPEDRIHVGLNMQTSLEENALLSREDNPEFNNWGFLIRSAVRKFASSIIDRYSVASATPEGGIVTLSGGNMQKVVVGRELAGDPKLILANQPTRGLDVGSIEFVHKTLIKARDDGAAVLLISVELDEIFSLSDRIAVIYNGRIVGEFEANEATEYQLGVLMAGGSLDQKESMQDKSPAEALP